MANADDVSVAEVVTRYEADALDEDALRQKCVILSEQLTSCVSLLFAARQAHVDHVATTASVSQLLDRCSAELSKMQRVHDLVVRQSQLDQQYIELLKERLQNASIYETDGVSVQSVVGGGSRACRTPSSLPRPTIGTFQSTSTSVFPVLCPLGVGPSVQPGSVLVAPPSLSHSTGRFVSGFAPTNQTQSQSPVPLYLSRPGQQPRFMQLNTGGTPAPGPGGGGARPPTSPASPSSAPPRPLPTPSYAAVAPMQVQVNAPPQLVCWDCGVHGHRNRDCPGRLAGEARPNQIKGQSRIKDLYSRIAVLCPLKEFACLLCTCATAAT
jgi:hypothetical protein